jgi:hypothetical protein
MEHPKVSGLSLNKALEIKGWFWENNRLYAPRKTFWIEGVNNENLSPVMLASMYHRMKETLEKLIEDKPSHLTSEQHEDWLNDMVSMVSTLKRLVEENLGSAIVDGAS